MIKEKVEKLEIFLETKKAKMLENLPYLLMFFLMFIILFAMHHLLAMYFDDFGNASLSYNQSSADIVGTNYTLTQLWEWCKVTYMNWGGRILWASVFLIPLLKFGAGIYFAIQSVVITLIFYYIFKIAEHITKKRHLFLPIILLILYGLIHINFLRHGIYWASASILYIWPLLPLFAFMYLYLKLTEKIENKEKIKYAFYLPVLLILNFFATFSQEQISVAMLAFLTLFIIINHYKKWKQFRKIDIPNIIVCLISFALLMVAPGNYARLDTNIEFAELSLIGKVMKNLPSLLLIIFRSEMTIFMSILTVVFILCLLKYRQELKIKSKTIFLSNSVFILFSFFCILLQSKIKVLAVIYGIVWILYIGIWMIIYGYHKKKLNIVVMAISGCASIFCLVISPVVGGRTCLPFIFYLFLLILIFVNDLLKDSKNYISICVFLIMVPFALKSAYNFGVIYNGYLANYDIERLNYDILKKHYGTEQTSNITLYKSKDTSFGVSRSYEEPSIDFWIKEYFNIPQEVEFDWVDIYEEFRNEN